MDQKLETKIKEAENNLLEFTEKLFPFRKHPECINNLTSKKIYNPHQEDKDYFFYWIEYKLKKLGHLNVPAGKERYTNAINNIDTLKQLLKIVVDDTLSISEKIDAPWENIKGFGSDKQIAKKILFCYYPKKIICAYNTRDLEKFSKKLDLKYQEKSYKKYKKNYNDLSVGQKYELFNELLLNFKNQRPKYKKLTNGFFVGHLYSEFPPSRVRQKKQFPQKNKKVRIKI